MLQLKKQQLQAEIALIVSKAEAVAAKEAACRDALSGWISLLATDAPAFEKLVRVRETKTSTSNIAGVSIPVFESLDLAVEPVDAWESPAWIDDAVASEKELLALRAERAVCEEQRRLVEEELRQTSQRVNLFEKVKIPECREAIRVIKIALGDEQTAAVTRGKIAKSRAPAADGRAE